jgi:hypothetical protein
VGISQYTGRKYSQAATRFEDPEGAVEAEEADDLGELEDSAVPALGVAWDDEEHATTAPASPMATKIDRPFITCTPYPSSPADRGWTSGPQYSGEV